MRCEVPTVARAFLVTVSVIFIIIGLLLFGLGCILITGGNLTSGYMVALFNALPDISGSLGSFFTYIAATILSVGAAMFILGTLGCCGASCLNHRLLYTYAGIMIFLLLIQIAGIILCSVLDAWVDEQMKGALQTTITREYGGDDVTDRISNAWNYAFVTYRCCGIHNYTDLHLAMKWNRTNIIPVTCCVLPGSYPDYGTPSDSTCTSVPTSSNANISKGCYEKIKSFLDTYMTYVIGVGAAIFVLELLTIICAFLLSRGRRKTVPISNKNGDHFR